VIDARFSLPFLAAAIWVAAATALVLLLQRLPHANLSVVYLLAVLIVAAREGFWPSVFASLLSFLIFNYLFTPPFFTLEVQSEGDIATLVFFLAVAALAGNLAARMRSEMAKSHAAVQRTSRLLSFSRRMAAAASAQAAMSTLAESAAQALRCTALVWARGEDSRMEMRAKAGPAREVPAAHEVELAWQTQFSTYNARNWLFLPIGTSARRVSLLCVARAILEADEEELLISLCDQTMVAIERVMLASDLDEARVASEAEQFRSALLSSVSHDLRTPLATIIGAITSLQELWENLSAKNRRALMQTVLDESNRLDRYIQNLLDMTRLGHGAPSLMREWVDLNDIVASAVQRLDTVLGAIRLDVEIEPDAALVHVHGAFIEQAFVNLLENAAKYSPDGGLVRFFARREGASIVIDVVDQGPGIPESEREAVFDMFYSIKGRDGGDQGSGLGLAICRGLIGAHGGDIRALPSSDGSGTCMRVTLPATDGDAPDAPDEQD
jgi:two-component system, OmpR family, sensor histidine kinase KdpD